MSFIQLACLILATSFVKISEGQCYGRNAHHGSGSASNNGFTRAYLPVVLTDQLPRDGSSRNPIVPDQPSAHSVLTNEDLNALLQLARVLENDKTACATKGIDVDRLLETLVKALVYTTTHSVEASANRCNKAVEIDANGSLLGQNGLVERLLSIILGGQSTSANGGVIRSVTQGTVTSETKTGQGLVNLGLGQDGLNLNVGDLVNARVGGTGSPVGTTGTSTMSSVSSGSSSSSSTSTVGGLLGNGGTQTGKSDKGLLGGVTGNDGVVGGLLTGNGDKGLLGGNTGNDGVVGGLLKGVGGTVDELGDTVGGLL